MYDKYCVIDLSQLPSSYSKKRTYVQDGKTLHCNFCLQRKLDNLQEYNSYIAQLSRIVQYDSEPGEAVKWIEVIASLYTDAAWEWFCSFNDKHPNNVGGNYI
jgi:hypothetical protein